MDHRVFLHVKSGQLIHSELKELPHHTDRHGEAERYDGGKKRRQIKYRALAPVQQVHQREADGRRQEPVQRMERCVPEGKDQVKLTDLAQDLRRKNKDQNDDLQRRRQLHPERDLHQARHDQKNQSQRA